MGKLNEQNMERKCAMESKKRKDYLSWDEYFMAIAKLSAMRSKDPSTQVGACIVSNDNRIYQLDTMVLQMVMMMIYFLGIEKGKIWKQNIHMYVTQN